MTTRFSVTAEFDRLQAVRVHEPGLEIWSGAVDPASHLFESPVAPDQARRQHRRYVDVLAANGVTAHTLAGDLAAADVLDDLIEASATVESDVDLGATLATLDPHEKLQ